MTQVLAWFRKAFKSNYVSYLETEIERLRAELLRWQNATLNREGLPPLIPRETKPQQVRTGRPLPSQYLRAMSARTGLKDKPDA